MRYTILICSICFIGILFNSVTAQDASNKQINDLASVTAPKDANPVLNDPKLTPGEIEQLKTAGEDNPSKIEEGLIDPKMDPLEIPDEESYGESNANAEPIVEREEVKPIEATASTTSVSTHTQPEGKKPENKTSYSKNTGQNPGVQPEGNKPAKKVIYMKKSGTNTQPEGNKPSDK